MNILNGTNERMKRRYFDFLKEADGRSPKTIDLARRAIAKYDKFVGGKDYRKFTVEDAKSFKRALMEGDGKRRSELSSRSAAHATLTAVRRFFRWLAGQPGYKSAISYHDVDYFSLSNRDRRIAAYRRAKPSPSLEQMQHVIRSMPAATDLELRDRALLACALLTGARISALISFKLKHVRRDRLGIEQDAREVETKFGKSFTTIFFPVGADIESCFLQYIDHLRDNLRLSGSDPLFPRTLQVVGPAHMFENEGLTRQHWTTPEAARRIFRTAFAAAGVPYYSPHSLRRTLTCLGQQLCRTPEEMKAWSQNLGHNEVLTTMTNYGAVPDQRQAEILRTMGEQPDGALDDGLDRLAKLLSEVQASRKAMPNVR